MLLDVLLQCGLLAALVAAFATKAAVGMLAAAFGWRRPLLALRLVVAVRYCGGPVPKRSSASASPGNL